MYPEDFAQNLTTAADKTIDPPGFGSIPQGHPVYHFFYAWEAMRAQRSVPPRAAFDPVQVPELLPYIAILDWQRETEGLAYRYRLVGTEVVTMLGQDPTGRYVRDLVAPERFEERRAAYATAIGERRPVFTSRSVPVRDREFIRVHTGLFPFDEQPGGNVFQLFLVAAPRDRRL